MRGQVAMLEIWTSVGYILLLVIVLYAAILWRTGSLVAAISVPLRKATALS